MKPVLSRGFSLDPTVPSPTQHFRNRAKMVVSGSTDQPIIGILGSELLHCPIHHPRLNEVIAALPEFIRDYRLIPYAIETRKGELKGLILFHSPETQETYLRFVLRSKECASRIRKLLPALQSRFPHLVCVTANVQPVPHAILEGKEEIFITERRFIEHRLGPITLNLSPQAFVQTNATVATQLYQTAAEWIAQIHPEKMLELFCGQGAFSFFSAQSASTILGIELNEEAVQTANETAKRYGFSNLRFECQNASAAPSTGADLILVNPPRRGLGDALSYILQELPGHFVYSSCSHETLSKDLTALASRYQIKRAQIFDLFPHTDHFETLVLLERKEAVEI